MAARRCSSALEAADGPDRDDDGRTGGQRNADNLIQIAAAYLAGGDDDTRPEVSANLVIDLDTLIGADRRELHDVTRELEHLGPVAQETALRLACDASVIRAVMRGTSEMLDLGRSSRIVSRA